MFLNLDKHDRAKTAIKDDSGYSLTYEEVCNTIRQFAELKLPRSVIFCLCESSAGSLIGYLAFENNGQVPLLLSANLDEELRNNLEQTYLPSFFWAPERKAGHTSCCKGFPNTFRTSSLSSPIQISSNACS